MKPLFLLLIAGFSATTGYGQIFGTLRVVARDPQNLAVPNADVSVKARASEWSQTGKTNSDGEATFQAVPIGQYLISIKATGFAASSERAVEVISNSVTPVQMQLQLGGVEQAVQVTDELPTVNPESSSTQTLTSRLDIIRTPDADRTGSLAMITDNVPAGTFAAFHVHPDHAAGGEGDPKPSGQDMDIADENNFQIFSFGHGGLWEYDRSKERTPAKLTDGLDWTKPCP
jgi:hypothetical protein